MDKTKSYVRIRKGRWHYRFYFQGREYAGPTGLAGDDSNRSAAEGIAAAERARVEELAARPRLVQPASPVTVGGTAPFRAAAEAFLAWAKDVEYRAKPSTAERIRVSFQSAIAFFGETPVSAIDVAAIEAYKERRVRVHEVRDITLRHDLDALSVFWRKYAIRRGLTKANPLGRGADGYRLVSMPSARDAVRFHLVTPDEEARYFATAARLHALHLKQDVGARPNMADLARMMLDQGARPMEILAARTAAFSAGSRTLRIEFGKTAAARRTLYLTDASLEILTRRAAIGSEWLFPSEQHPGHHLGLLQTTHDRICRDAGLAFVVYDFRHTFATRMIEAGKPVAVVAAILGHGTLGTIHRYVHPSAEAQRSAMLGPRTVGE
jgi:integrase